jgi:hypothetical protein
VEGLEKRVGWVFGFEVKEGFLVERFWDLVCLNVNLKMTLRGIKRNLVIL